MTEKIRAASTVVVVRDNNNHLEVLLLARNPTIGGAHYGDAFVFPGGAVEKEDSHAAWKDVIIGADTIGPRFDDPNLSFDAFRIAAVRECFEEAGLLLGCAERGVSLSQEDGVAPYEKSFLDLCRESRFDLEDVVYTSHWLTPKGRPKRFDTRFFTAALPVGQTVRHDGVEALAHHLLRPTQALSLFYNRKLTLWPPTQYSLLMLSEFSGVTDLMEFLTKRDADVIPRIYPRLDELKQPIFPWDKSY
ncbi:MAG: hypothetical protein AAF438_08785 [Pseudomonadota bacterium]